MTRRYFVPDLPAQGGLVALPTEEAVHAARVMRVAVGDPVVLFAGDGRQASGEITSVDRRRVFCQVAPASEVSRELRGAITITACLPKGDRAKWMVEKLTELGVANVQPIVTTRSQATPSASTLNKLRKQVIEASKQSGRNQLMTILEPTDFCDHLAALDSQEAFSLKQQLRVIAHPGGAPLKSLDLTIQSAVNLFIGPEGGFTDQEVEAASDAGCQAIGLGPTILRVETAATAAASAIIAIAGW
ncbi:RsmE family RNA methyltransferase [Planctomycetaceae bacterium SH139]